MNIEINFEQSLKNGMKIGGKFCCEKIEELRDVLKALIEFTDPDVNFYGKNLEKAKELDHMHHIDELRLVPKGRE